ERLGISVEIVDLRTIVPLDVETIVGSVSKTGRLLVVDEGFSMCGLGAELAAVMMEHAFDELDAPVGRLHTDPVGHPFSPAHEQAVIVTVERIVAAAQAVMAGKPIVPRRLSASYRGSGSSTPRNSVTVSLAAGAAVSPSAASQESDVPLLMPNQDLTITE